MSVRLVLVADTHLPTRAKALPGALLEAIAGADGVVHAGDWVDESTLDLLQRRTPLLIAVAGNNDGPGLHARLPEVARAEIDGVRLAVVHETGAAPGRERRIDAAFPDADLLVFGHSHIPWDTTSAGGLRLLNPGSPTDRRRQPNRTFMVATLNSGHVEVDLVRLP